MFILIIPIENLFGYGFGIHYAFRNAGQRFVRCFSHFPISVAAVSLHRAAEQSKWYPVIYDVKNDKEILDVTYDIKVDCKDCKTIYINGANAESGPSVKFTSYKARKLLLFTGDYTKQALSKMTFLNADLTKEEAGVFDRNINDIIDFYSAYLHLPYGETITFMQHQSVAPQAPKSSWGFVAFPTIAISGTTSTAWSRTRPGHHVYAK